MAKKKVTNLTDPWDMEYNLFVEYNKLSEEYDKEYKKQMEDHENEMKSKTRQSHAKLKMK